MGRDEDGEPTGGELMNFVPEFAAGLGVDTRGGLIEEQEFGFVN